MTDRRLWWGRLLAVIGQVCAAGLLLTSAWLIVRAAEQPPVMYLMVAIVGVRFFGFARTGLRYAERLVLHDVALRRVAALRVQVYEALEVRIGAFADPIRRGDLVRRIVADVDVVQDRLLRLRGPWVVALATSGVVAFAIGVIHRPAGLIVAAGAAFAMIVVRVAPRPSAVTGSHQGALAAETANSLVAGPDLVVAGVHPRGALTRIDAIEADERRTLGSEWLHVVVMAATAAAVYGVTEVWGGVDPVVAGVLALAPLALIEPLEALIDAERLRPEILAAERRLGDLMAAPAIAPAGPLVPATAIPSRHDLTVARLVVGWGSVGGGKAHGGEGIAEPVTFELPEGEAIVVTGPSGVGKSTLALTLAQFLRPHSGEVRLGGVDTRELDPADVRSIVGLLGQDEMVFDTTVRENLRIAQPDASDEDFAAALERAGLGAWLRGAANGLDTEVGERGSALSGGERQRLGLARLLLGHHRVLIVDEPTEHLDDQLARSLMDDLEALIPSVSLIVISHDPRVLERFDRHVTMQRAVGRSLQPI